MRASMEDWEELSMKKNDQRTCTCFLAKYGELSLYDIDFGKRYSIDDKSIHFVKGYGYALIGNPDHQDENRTDHKYFCIHDDLFDRILETNKNSDITLKVIHKELLFSSINDNITDSRYKIRSWSEMVPHLYQLQRKQQKQVHDYSQKSIGDFKFIIVNPSTNLLTKESVVL